MWSPEHVSWPKEHKTLSHRDFSVEEMSNKAQRLPKAPWKKASIILMVPRRWLAGPRPLPHEGSLLKALYVSYSWHVLWYKSAVHLFKETWGG